MIVTRVVVDPAITVVEAVDVLPSRTTLLAVR
jgi:hypothetical protein